MDGSFYARVNLSDFDVCRLRSCVRPFDAVDITAGLDEVRTLGPNQTSELVGPDNTFCSLRDSPLSVRLLEINSIFGKSKNSIPP